MIESQTIFKNSGIHCLVTPCSARKAKLSGVGLRCSDLGPGTLEEVAESWQAVLRATEHELMPARHLYLGTSVQRVVRVGRHLNRPVWIMSAGLGLISAEERIPAYDLTLSPRAPDALQGRVKGEFDPTQWWESVQSGPFAAPVSALATDASDNGRILVALTRPYGLMVGKGLASLPESIRTMLRIFGAGIRSVLPESLQSQVVDFDERLDQLVPGIKLDGATRALEYFVSLIRGRPTTGIVEDQALLDEALSRVQRLPHIVRSKVSDDDLRSLVAPWHQEGLSFSQALRRLRDQRMLSCEEKRFRRIYQEIPG
ncbi:Uncharacterised protein [Stenotrophomonas maltophilia]|nr:Uncharacterised protein [Stenotrophomonas maltophilia]